MCSVDQRSRPGILEFSVQGFRRLQSKCCPQHCSSESPRVLKGVHSSCWQNWVPCSCNTEGAFFLLGVKQGPISNTSWACMHAQLLQSCPTLCDAMDWSLPSSSAHGILQARIPTGLPSPTPGDLPDPGIEPVSPVSSELQVDSLLLSHWGSPMLPIIPCKIVSKTEKETQMYRTDFWTRWEKARVGCFKRTASKHVYYL